MARGLPAVIHPEYETQVITCAQGRKEVIKPITLKSLTLSFEKWGEAQFPPRETTPVPNIHTTRSHRAGTTSVLSLWL